MKPRDGAIHSMASFFPAVVTWGPVKSMRSSTSRTLGAPSPLFNI
jgi:hypothetical protein